MARFGWALIWVSLGLAALPHGAQAQAGPRPVLLTDAVPRNAFSLGTEYVQLGGRQALTFPIALEYQLEDELVFTAELPMGYVAAAGDPVQPRTGAGAIGVRGAMERPLAGTGSLRLGAALVGRYPFVGVDDLGADQLGALRKVSMYRSERWSPGLGMPPGRPSPGRPWRNVRSISCC